MQLSIEAIVFHCGEVEVRKFNLLDRARFSTIPQLGELYEKRLRRFKTARKLRSGPCATRKKRSPPIAENGPSRSSRLSYLTPVARYRHRVSPCTSFNRTPHFSRRRITVSRSRAFCYATTALIHYSCAAETRLATWVHAPHGAAWRKFEGSGVPPVLVPPPLFRCLSPSSLTNGLCLCHCKDKHAARKRDLSEIIRNIIARCLSLGCACNLNKFLIV